MEVQHDRNVIYRCVPRENLEINKYWMCDEGRFNYHTLQDEKRVVYPTVLEAGSLQAVSWTKAIESVKQATSSDKVGVLLGTDLTQEELSLAVEFLAKRLSKAEIFHFGTPGIKTVSDDKEEDAILKMKSKTANLNGAEQLGIRPFAGEKYSTYIVFSGGRATIPQLPSNATSIGVGVFMADRLDSIKLILPGAGFAEKDGTVFNKDGIKQHYRRAIMPPRNSKYLSEIFMIWANATGKSENE